jgi:hypothetical protein
VARRPALAEKTYFYAEANEVIMRCKKNNGGGSRFRRRGLRQPVAAASHTVVCSSKRHKLAINSQVTARASLYI